MWGNPQMLNLLRSRWTNEMHEYYNCSILRCSNMSSATSTQVEPISPSPRPAYLSPVILFSAMLIIVLACISWVYLKRRESERWGIHLNDLEGPVTCFTVERLNNVAPAQSYKKWRDQMKHSPRHFEPSNNNTLVCVFCLEAMQGKQIVRSLPCGHAFHSECITKWFMKRHDTCPVCKQGDIPHTVNILRPPPPAVTRPRSM
ncbi:hypothetical protein B0J13DRAFT_150576 [Dactylonectria estremocensis]|uniref:RING-type domain-containing protein n=1 Tax=Dactylonectria estremocensis TaxID=1079267 RepID=A0A9P9IMW0_9HYPO|nr:hypothetical protein B0J13DRAFT_150576 [Dactylonectria estremocensis]